MPLKKVPGGKLVRLEITADDEHITSCRITGDFFLHPEYALIRMERSITHAALPLDRAALKNTLLKATAGATLVGFSIDDIIALLEEALMTAAPDKGGDTHG